MRIELEKRSGYVAQGFFTSKDGDIKLLSGGSDSNVVCIAKWRSLDLEIIGGCGLLYKIMQCDKDEREIRELLFSIFRDELHLDELIEMIKNIKDAAFDYGKKTAQTEMRKSLGIE